MAASIKTVLEIDNSKYNAGIDQSTAKTKKFANEIDTSSSDITGAFGRMGTAALGLATALGGLGAVTARFADEITDLATAHQTSTTEILALGKALAQNGGSMDSMGRLMQTMANNINSAAEGNLKMATTFERLGVSMQDIGTASETEIRDKLIAGIAGIQDPAARAAQAMDVFGKAAMGVDFTNLAASIAENNAKYAEHESAIRSAAAAYDAIAGILTDIKIAFASAFQPAFEAIAKLKPEINSIVVALKLLVVGIAALTAAAAVAKVMALVKAFQLLRVAIAANPIGLIASLISTAAAAALVFGDSTDEATAATESNTNAVKTNLKVQRDLTGLTTNRAKEVEGLRKVTDSYLAQNDALNRKLDLELQSLGQSEEQKRVVQQLADIDQAAQKALIDLKNTYNNLDADGRARTKQAYLEQQEIIKQNAEIEKKSAENQIATIELRKRLLSDINASISIYNDTEVKLFKTLNERKPLSGKEAITNELAITAAIDKRKTIIDEINKQKLDPRLVGVADAMLSVNIDEAKRNFQGA